MRKLLVVVGPIPWAKWSKVHRGNTLVMIITFISTTAFQNCPVRE
jgi:hypothetical protein